MKTIRIITFWHERPPS